MNEIKTKMNHKQIIKQIKTLRNFLKHLIGNKNKTFM